MKEGKKRYFSQYKTIFISINPNIRYKQSFFELIPKREQTYFSTLENSYSLVF